jgi:protein O-GlcNAc transferase
MVFDFGSAETINAAEKLVIDLISDGNLALAEIKSREMLLDRAQHGKAFNFMGAIADACGLPGKAEEFLKIAALLNPDWDAPTKNLNKLRALSYRSDAKSRGGSNSPRYLLIKAWGAGFWSDVSHVIGQALLAELTGRIPVVHWGTNSLFYSGAHANAFDAYFEPIADLRVEALIAENFDIWPPKWNRQNLLAAEVDKWRGPFSRLAGLYLLGRDEGLVVSDFFASVFDLTVWIPVDDPKYAMTFDELYTYLMAKYLRPKPSIVEKAVTFYDLHLRGKTFISVHVRGSDKISERPGLDSLNAQYHEVIAEYRRRHATPTIFLMTDDARILEDYVRRYGRDVIFTDCVRTATSRGVHAPSLHDREQLGIEVMVDALVAHRGIAFIGNGSSNPSQMVRYLGSWKKENVSLLGDNIYRLQDEFLHRT